MDPLTLAATAIAATVMTKFWEKTGEKLGEKVFIESNNFLSSLSKRSPEIATAIEQLPKQPLDYGQAVLEVEVLARKDVEISESMKTLVQAVIADPNADLTAKIQEIIKTLKTQEPTLQNLEKLADKIGLVVYGGNITIENLNV